MFTHKILATLLLAVALSAACSNPARPSHPLPSTTEKSTPSVLQQWQTQTRDVSRRTRSGFHERVFTLKHILAQLPPDKFEAEFSKLNPDEIEYENDWLPWAMTLVLVERNDEAALIRLWSARCPEYVGEPPLEKFLAHSDLQNPWALLQSAYEKSDVANQNVILQVFANAFLTQYLKSKSDGKVFIKNCVQWYAQNKEQLEVNRHFEHIDYSVFTLTVNSLKADPDFKSDDLYILPNKK